MSACSAEFCASALWCSGFRAFLIRFVVFWEKRLVLIIFYLPEKLKLHLAGSQDLYLHSTTASVHTLHLPFQAAANCPRNPSHDCSAQTRLKFAYFMTNSYCLCG